MTMLLPVLLSLGLFMGSSSCLAKESPAAAVYDEDLLTLAAYAALSSGVSHWAQEHEFKNTEPGGSPSILSFLKSMAIADEEVGPFWYEAHLCAERGWEVGGLFYATAYAYWELTDHVHLKKQAIARLTREIRRNYPKVMAKLTTLREESSWQERLQAAILLLEAAAYPERVCPGDHTTARNKQTCAFVRNTDSARDQLFAKIPKPPTTHLPLWFYDDVAEDGSYLMEELRESDEWEPLKEFVLSDGSLLLSFGLRSCLKNYLGTKWALGNRILGYLVVALNNDLLRLVLSKTLPTHPLHSHQQALAKTFKDQSFYLVYNNPYHVPKTWGRFGQETVAYVADTAYFVGLASLTYPVSLLLLSKVTRWTEPQIRQSLGRELILEMIQAQLFTVVDALAGRYLMDALQELLVPKDKASPPKIRRCAS